MKRYLIGREIGNYYNPTKPHIPFGFLINLGIQFIGTGINLNGNIAYKKFVYIADESKRFATLYGVQPYSFMDEMTYNHANFFSRTVASIIFDNIYVFGQLNFSYLKFILPTLFEFVPGNDFTTLHGFSKEQFYDVANKIIGNYGRFNVKIRAETFQSSIEKKTIRNIFDHLSTDSDKANLGYDFPEDFNRVNAQEKPLVKNHIGYYYMADKSWCAPAFINCMAGLCAESYKKGTASFWRDLGFAVEKLIRTQLTEKQIKYSSGRYYYDGKEAECDFVIHDDEKIIFIETKNKALTKTSKAGDDVQILNDLLSSMVSSIEQTGRHRLAIESQGFLKFEDGNEILLNNRRIERYGVSFEEFGSVHSNNLTMELLRNLAISDIKFTGEVHPATEKNIQKIMEKFKGTMEDLRWTDKKYLQKEFFDCKFYSIQMLLLMLENSSTATEFIKELNTCKFVSTTSRDFYIDYRMMRQK